MKKQGMVYLVGAGPGARGLMTLRGFELLKKCDALVYDHLASEEFLSCLKEGCRVIYVGKQAGHHSMKQEKISQLLVSLAKEGLDVVRLKGGDPFVFGRGGEEILALREADIPWELVPGVSSAIAVPELAGIPVTHRQVSRSFHVMTGHCMEGDNSLLEHVKNCGSMDGTLVFLMGRGQLKTIVQGLLEGGKPEDTPSAIIEKGTLPGQRIVRAPLSSLAKKADEAGIQTPAIIVVGETASYDLLCQKEAPKRPLEGIHVGMIGTEDFQERFEAALLREGAVPEPVLTLKLTSYAASPAMALAYSHLASYSWLLFTSANGVHLFFEGLTAAGGDLRALGHIKFAVIGPGTGAALKKHGFLADYMPDTHSAAGLAEGLCSLISADSGRLLIPRSEDGSRELTRILNEAGFSFDDIPLYKLADLSSCPFLLPAEGCPDYVAFASASGVRSFFEKGCFQNKGGWPEKTRALCIGALTAKALLEYGKKPDVTAASYDIEGLINALKQDVKQHETDE